MLLLCCHCFAVLAAIPGSEEDRKEKIMAAPCPRANMSKARRTRLGHPKLFTKHADDFCLVRVA